MKTPGRLFLPYDIYERHKKVGSLIKKGESVLDVGGEMDHLNLFCKPSKIIVANLTSGDVIISKAGLPFKKNSFDVVCAIDVLEHIPKPKRLAFVKSILNVASDKVILSFPIGTPAHVKYEKELQNWLEKKGHNITYLKEHIKYNLPTLAEVQNITNNLKTRTSFSGNIKINKVLFKIFIFDPKIKYVRRVTFYVKKIFNFLSNPFFYQFLINQKYSQSVNRIYLIIYKPS